MGTIVHAPLDAERVDDWAIVLNGIVVNVIVADLNFIYLIQDDYDYLIDVTEGENTGYGTEYTYDHGTDTFTAPAYDYVAELTQSLDQLISALSIVQEQASYLTQPEIATAISGSYAYLYVNEDLVELYNGMLDLIDGEE